MKFKIGQKVYDKHFKCYGKVVNIINDFSEFPIIVKFNHAKHIKWYNHNGDCWNQEKKGTLIIPLIDSINKLLEL